MRLEEIMTSPVEVIGPEAAAKDARSLMRQQRIHHLVVMSGRQIIGVVSERDTARAAVNETVADVMTEGVVTAAPDTTIKRAANLMRGRAIGCLPVWDGRRAIGMVTTADLLTLLGRGAERPNPRGTRRTLADRGPRRKPRPSPDATKLAY
jgi:acetoin utilization protein AcuB